MPIGGNSLQHNGQAYSHSFTQQEKNRNQAPKLKIRADYEEKENKKLSIIANIV